MPHLTGRRLLMLTIPLALLVGFAGLLRLMDREASRRWEGADYEAPPGVAAVDLLPMIEAASTGDIFVGQNGGATEFYKGAVRDLRLFGRALSREEAEKGFGDQGLLGLWQLDETTGTNAADSSGRGNPAILAGTGVWTSDSSGRGLLLDGITGHLRVPRSPSFESPAVSISCWIRREGDQGAWANVVRKAWHNNGNPTFASWSLQLNPDGLGSRIVAFNTGFAGGHHRLLSPGDSIPDRVWTHLVAVYDPLGAPPQKRLYVNGTLAASATETREIAYVTLPQEWRFEDKALMTPLRRRSMERIPILYTPPQEYDLAMTVERLQGAEGLHVGLRHEKASFVLVLDAFRDGSYYSGIDTIDGKEFRRNDTTVTSRCFPTPRQSHTLHCTVRNTGVRVFLNGKAIMDWQGPYERLRTSGPMAFPHAEGLYLGSFETQYRITRLDLIPVTGEGKKLR